MLVRPLDTLLAVKAINLAPGLLEKDRRVATVLIEHFNRKTGRCDPGLERLAALIGCSTRTVIRAIARLEKANIVRKNRHGGYSNRNSYEPNWLWFSQQETIWREKMRARSASREKKVSPGERLSCHAPADSPVTQTYQTNQQFKTCESLPRDTKSESVPSTVASPRPRLAPRLQRPFDAAQTAAERRWMNALNARFASLPVTYAEILNLITPALQATATESEMQRPGDGLEYIIKELRLKSPTHVAHGKRV